MKRSRAAASLFYQLLSPTTKLDKPDSIEAELIIQFAYQRYPLWQRRII
jgi:hypothetical protein